MVPLSVFECHFTALTGSSLEVRGLFCPEATKQQQADLRGLLQLQFEVTAYVV